MRITGKFPRGLALLALAAGRMLAAEASSELAGEARKELFAARYRHAAELYSKLAHEEPGSGEAWYGLVRADLEEHRAREAYAAADEALRKAPQTAGAQTAAGLAAWRKGEVTDANGYFSAALKLDPNYPGALRGQATILGSLSKFRTARDLRLKAWTRLPDDPDLMLAHANTLKGAEHLAALEAVLPLLDPDSEPARNLRVHIANDRAVGDTKLRRLVSPYQNGTVKLFSILNSPTRLRGLGVRVQLNHKQTADLMLDTGASGISLSPKMAEKAGLRAISGEASEAKGIGDGKPQAAVAYLASEVRAGDVVFADYPISVFRSAQSSDYDGLIGADVFQRFLVRIDFVHPSISLETRPQDKSENSDEPVDQNDALATGFQRVLRFGDHLGIATAVNDGRGYFFLIDSGSSMNIIDTEIAKKFTHTAENSRIVARGVQGKVDKVSVASRISLSFAGLRQDNPDLLAFDLTRMSDQMGVQFGGILGMPVLGSLTITIDYRVGAVRFEYKR